MDLAEMEWIETTRRLAAQAQPRAVVISAAHGFSHLLQTLLDDVGVAVRTGAVDEGAPQLVDRVQPGLVILDIVPGHEARSWLILEALKARSSTRPIPVVLCPAAPWLLDGHEDRIAQHGALTWCNAFDLHDLLAKVEIALAQSAERHGPSAVFANRRRSDACSTT
jgi:DNA-binding response OmpR family regulator